MKKAFTLIVLPAARNGFTIIELLVVITIIVVLLALLTPALDAAIRQAELAVCAAQLRAVGSAATVYTQDFRRRYPHRPALEDSSIATVRPVHLTYSPLQYPHNNLDGYDDRPTYRPYFPIEALMCPLSEEVDLDAPDASVSSIWVNYPTWFGWKYKDLAAWAAGMFRLGERFTWAGERFDTLAGDFVNYVPFGGVVESSHSDSKGAAAQVTKHDEDWNSGANGKLTQSYYVGSPGAVGDYDPAFAKADGSVQRYKQVLFNARSISNPFQRDGRISTVGLGHDQANASSTNGVLIPRGK